MKEEKFLLLVLILLFASFFASHFKITGTVTKEAFVLINDYRCEAVDGGFRVCETVEWGGVENGYAKGYVLGGERLSEADRQYASPFTYCQDISGGDYKRVGVQAYVYDAANRLVALDKSKAVECSRSVEMGEFVKRVYFNAQRNTGHGLGFGVVEIKLPGDPISCTVDGYWESDNEGRGTSGIKRYCHKARGILQGYVDFYEQYVVEDPDYFIWAGPSKPKANPLEKRYNGEILHARLCDNQYYQEDGERYIAIGKVVDFSKDLKIEWSYVNEDTMPVVNFIFDLKCKLKEEKVGRVQESRENVESEIVEDIGKVEEPRKVDEEIVPFEMPVERERRVGFWERIREYLRDTFL